MGVSRAPASNEGLMQQQPSQHRLNALSVSMLPAPRIWGWPMTTWTASPGRWRREIPPQRIMLSKFKGEAKARCHGSDERKACSSGRSCAPERRLHTLHGRTAGKIGTR